MNVFTKDIATLSPTRNTLPAPARAQVATLLNRRLADAIDLQAQCKQAHWNVKGPGFIGLHKLFDEVYAGVSAYVDLLAERIVQLGGAAEGTIRIAAERSELDEYPLAVADGTEHVKWLAGALASFGSRIRFAVQEVDELEDVVSADLCTEVSRGIDQWLWMVEAHLPMAHGTNGGSKS